MPARGALAEGAASPVPLPLSPNAENLPNVSSWESRWCIHAETLNPETAGWPSLSLHIHLALQHLPYAIGCVTGPTHPPRSVHCAGR
jgi:hypothetical protein